MTRLRAVAVIAAALAGCSDAAGGEGAGGGTSASASASGQGGGGDGGGGGAATSTVTTGAGGCGDLATDVDHCGECDNVCAPGQTCVGGACACGTASVSFAMDVQPILTASCAKNLCHAGANPKAGLDLTAANAHAELVGVDAGQCSGPRKRVEPGTPSESYLIDKVMATDLCGTGKKMPPSGALLSDSKIQVLADWICAGAPDN